MPLQLGFHVVGFLAQTPAVSIFVFKNYVETEVFKETPSELHSKPSYSDWDWSKLLTRLSFYHYFSHGKGQGCLTLETWLSDGSTWLLQKHLKGRRAQENNLVKICSIGQELETYLKYVQSERKVSCMDCLCSCSVTFF